MKRRIARREFIARTALGAAALCLGGRGASAAGAPKLVQVTGPGVPGDVAGALRMALEPLGGMGAFVKKGQRVLLKPNLGFPRAPEHRSITSPQFVAAVAREVLEQGASRVRIMDHSVQDPELVLKNTGLPEAVRGLDLKIVLPKDAILFAEVDLPRGRQLRTTEVLREALACNVHIALPVAKSHDKAIFTGVLKGMMGLVRNRLDFHLTYDLNQAIADLNTLLKADLCIMDGLSVMTSGGPAGPGPLQVTNTLIAGTDPVAVDAAGVRLAPLFGRKIEPKKVKHLALAAAMGLGKLDLPEDQMLEIEL